MYLVVGLLWKEGEQEGGKPQQPNMVILLKENQIKTFFKNLQLTASNVGHTRESSSLKISVSLNENLGNVVI